MSRKRIICNAISILLLPMALYVWADGIPPLQGNPPPPPPGGGGGGSPTGSAGGDLGGTYPNPIVVSVGDVSIGILNAQNGGTGRSTLTAHGVLLGEGTAPVGLVAPSATNQLLASNGGSADPTFQGIDAVLDASAGTTANGFIQRIAGHYTTHALAASDLPAHASTHNAGGSDALAIDAAAGTGSLRTIGTGALQACAGNDSRLSNARTPTAHASTHKSGGSDPVGTAVATANAIPYADSSGHLTNWIANMGGDSGSGGTAGLVPAPPAGSAAAGKFLKADGTFAVPATNSTGLAQFNQVDSNASTVPLLTTTLGTPVRRNSSALATLPTTVPPWDICYDGTNLWVSYGSGNPNAITYMVAQSLNYSQNLATITDTSNLHSPKGLCFDGTYIWVVNSAANGSGHYTVTKISPTTFSVVTNVDLGTSFAPARCCFDGTYVWVTATGRVFKINPTTNVLSATLTVGASTDMLDGICLCSDPRLSTMILGLRLAIANSSAHAIYYIYGGSVESTTTSLGSDSPHALTFDGTTIYCTAGSNKIYTMLFDVPTIFDVVTTSAGTDFITGAPNGIFYDGHSIFACGSGSLRDFCMVPWIDQQTVGALAGQLDQSGLGYSHQTNAQSGCTDGSINWFADSFSSSAFSEVQGAFVSRERSLPYIVAQNQVSTSATAVITSYTTSQNASSPVLQINTNLRVASGTSFSVKVEVDYTDVNSVAHTLDIVMQQDSGSTLVSVTNSQGVGNYPGQTITIAAKANTTTTVKVVGTFTSISYVANATLTEIQ